MRKICRLTSFNFKWVLVYILTSTVFFFYDSNQKIAICAKSMYMHSFFLKVTYLLIFTRQNIVWIEHLIFYFFMEKKWISNFSCKYTSNRIRLFVVIKGYSYVSCSNCFFSCKTLCKLIFQLQAFLSFLFQDRWVSMLCWKMFTSVWYSDKVSTLLY